MMVESDRFYQMHKLTGEYETRDPTNILSLTKIHSGLKQFGLRTTLYNRAPSNINIQPKKPEQVVTPIKLLYRFGPKENTALCTEPSPLFFFAFRNYDEQLYEYQAELEEFHAKIKNDERFKVKSVLEVVLGGVFAIPSEFVPGDFVRGRVTKVNVISGKITYWAIDNAYFGECTASDMLLLDKNVANWEMLAIPGIFESDPAPERLEKFACTKNFIMAKITQPKFGSDFLPRKVELF